METNKTLEKALGFFSGNITLLAFLAGVIWLVYSQTSYLGAFGTVDMIVTYGLAAIAVVTIKGFLARQQTGAGLGMLQIIHLIIAAAILGIISYIYVYYVPSIAAEGLYNLGLAKSGIDQSAGFQNVLYGIGVLAAAAMVIDFMAAANTGKSNKTAVFVLILLSSCFLFLLVAGVFGEGQRQKFQVKLSQREATEAISTMEVHLPPFASAERLILEARKEYEQIITAGDVNAANVRQEVLSAARDAANSCRALPGTLETMISDIRAIPEKEKAGGSVTSASGAAGEGPRYRALARALQAPISDISVVVKRAGNALANTTLPTEANKEAADVFGVFRSQCDLVRNDIAQRLTLLREAQATSFGDVFSAEEEAFVKGQQIQPVIRKVETVLKGQLAFPDLNALVAEQVDTEDMAQAKADLDSLSEMVVIVQNAKDEFLAKAEELRAKVDDIAWDAPKEVMEEQLREFFAEISVSASAFKRGKGQEIVSLATVLGNDELSAKLKASLDDYNPPAIEVPDEASLFDTWFNQEGEGYWQLFVAFAMALTVETLVLWGAIMLLTSLGIMFHNAGEARKKAFEAVKTEEEAESTAG